MPMIPEQIIKRLEQLESERSSYSSTWQELAKYCLPRKAFITRIKSPGQKVDHDIYDSTAIQSALVLAAGLHSYLTNPAQKWFTLRMQNKDLMDDKEVKVWLKQGEDRCYDALNNSNFSQQVHENYIDLTVFGTSCLYEEEDPKDLVRFYCRPLQEVFISEDYRGRVDTLYRKFQLTARQAWEQWGNEAGEEVTTAMEKKDYDKKITFVHCVMPRYERDVSKKDAVNMPFVSYYIEKEKKHLISEGGYEEFPFFVPRFNKESDEVYGTSPAWVSFPDIKMLNQISYTIIRAAQKIVDPPLLLPHDGFLLPIKLSPGAINYKTSGTPQDKVEQLITNANIPVGLEVEENKRLIIKRNFFVDLFLLLADPNRKDMTATEVMARVEEKMLILAPTLGRLMNELLDPIIDRTFKILLRNNLIPPPPPILSGQDYVIEYTSPLARAQRMEEMKAINQVITITGGIAQFFPDALDKINVDKLMDQIADLYNIHPEVVRSDDEVKLIREQRAQAQQRAQEMAMIQQGADIIKTGSEIDVNAAESKQIGTK